MIIRKWREKLSPASFRGVRFFIETSSSSGGRDWVKHELPGRDLPFHEDMRQGTRGFSLKGYVLGDDYFVARDALVDALDKPGPGILIHPFKGTLNVVALPYTYDEDFVKGGMAAFELAFEETGEVAVPEPAPDYDSLTDEAADEMDETALEEFAHAYDVEGPSFLTDGIVADISEWTSQGIEAIATIPDELEGSPVGKLLAALDDIDTDIQALLFQGDGLGNYMQNKIEGISNLDQYIGSFAAFNCLMDLSLFGDPSNTSPFSKPLESIPLTTAARLQQQENRDQFKALMARKAISEAAKLAVRTEYDSRREADYFREVLSEKLDDEITLAGDSFNDDGYLALKKLRVAMSKALSEKAGQLPVIIQYLVPPVAMPALVVAYNFYEDLSWEDDIVKRNLSIIHPGFLPSGSTIELVNG